MDIKNILTKEEKAFIKEHGLDYTDFYDGRNDKVRDFHDKAKSAGCRFVVSKTSICGHRLKTRSGHCICCRPANISFQKRYSEKGIIYIAKNGRYCKVGMLENNNNDAQDALYHRRVTLNMDGGYAGMEGWEIKEYYEVKNAGRVEKEIHTILSDYVVTGKLYYYSGEVREADELFRCPLKVAKEAVEKVINKTKR